MPNANPADPKGSDPAARFSDRAADYASARPGYPHEIVAAILAGFDNPDVADLGAGTGISARALANAGARVSAIEPNRSMRETIVRSDRIVAIDGTAEATTLADASVDVVTAFQAFHWFERSAMLREVRRIARPRARFAAVWNHRDRADAVMRAYDAVVDHFGSESRDLDAARRVSRAADALEQDGWRDVRVVRAPNVQHVTWERLAAYMRSCSYLPREGSSYEAMMREVRALFDEASREGRLRFAWVTEAYLADRQ